MCLFEFNEPPEKKRSKFGATQVQDTGGYRNKGSKNLYKYKVQIHDTIPIFIHLRGSRTPWAHFVNSESG